MYGKLKYEMSKQIIILLLICLSNAETIYAQWTEKDSVWLRNVLSGKEELKLNPEALKAIQSGTLINTEEPASRMKMAPQQSPSQSIQKDFSEYVHPKDPDYNPNRKVALKDLPPAVFMRYGLDKPLPRVKMLGSFYVSPSIRAQARKPSGISFDELLQQVFMPSARHKKRNAQRWQTQKYYNNYP